MRNYQPLDFRRYSPLRLLAQVAAGLVLVAALALVAWLRG